MNKSSMLLAAVGLAVLTGCGGNKVMEDRKYIPAKDENAIAEGRKIEDFTVPAGPESVPAPAEKIAAQPAAPAAPAPVIFAPMEGVKSSGGVSSAPRQGRRAAASARGGVYIVKRGDYLGRIARRHGISVQALMQANNLTEKDVKALRIGRKLIIPARGKAVKGKYAPAAGRKADAQAAPAAKGGIYIVRQGDFPARIARRHGVKVADLLKANNLTEASSRSLRIGQKLVIPGAGAPAAAAETLPKKDPAPAAPETPAAAQPAGVTEADKLASDLETTVSKAQTTAPAAVEDAAPATELLDITQDVPLKELAAKYNTTEEKLRSINDNFSGDVVKSGTFFFVPSKK